MGIAPSQSRSANHKLITVGASHDPEYVMEIYRNTFAQTRKLFFSSRLLAIMPLNLNAVFPCLKKEESEAQKQYCFH